MKRPLVAAWLWRPLRANAGLYAEVAAAAALVNLFGLASSLFSMTVYDRVVPANALGSLAALTTGMIVILVFDFAARTLRGLLIDHAGARVDREIAAALFERVLTLPLGQRRGSVGAFASSLREYETLRDLLTSATLAALVDLPFAAFFLGAIAVVGGPLVLVPLAVLPPVVGVALLSHHALARRTAQAVAAGQGKQGVLVETLGALETVQSVGAGPMLALRWQEAVDASAAATHAQRRLAARAANTAATGQGLAYAGTIAMGALMIGDGALSTGAVVACSLLAGRAVAPLGTISNLLVRMAHARAAYRALDRVIGVPAAPAPASVAPMNFVSKRPGRGADARDDAAISFADVGFAYPGTSRPALAGLSFTVASGERLGILGRSGSGKSTIARLLAGVHPVSRGELRIGRTGATPPRIGTAPQESALFTGTVAENIVLARAHVDDAALAHAVALAGLETLIGPGGLDRPVTGRGEEFSGGQRQAIALARVVAADPAIVVLDEPTSAMDAASEAELVQRLAPWLDGRTLVLITHRTPLLALCTRLVVLEHGRVALDGPRDAVLARLAAVSPGTAATVGTVDPGDGGARRGGDRASLAMAAHASLDGDDGPIGAGR